MGQSYDILGHLAGSVSRACDSWYWGCEFKPPLGGSIYLKKKMVCDILLRGCPPPSRGLAGTCTSVFLCRCSIASFSVSNLCAVCGQEMQREIDSVPGLGAYEFVNFKGIL